MSLLCHHFLHPILCSGVDYEFVGSSSATFLSGTMASSVQLRALSDAVEDCNETFSFILNITDTGGLAVSAGAVDTTQVTIIDDTGETFSAPLQ